MWADAHARYLHDATRLRKEGFACFIDASKEEVSALRTVLPPELVRRAPVEYISEGPRARFKFGHFFKSPHPRLRIDEILQIALHLRRSKPGTTLQDAVTFVLNADDASVGTLWGEAIRPERELLQSGFAVCYDYLAMRPEFSSELVTGLPRECVRRDIVGRYSDVHTKFWMGHYIKSPHPQFGAVGGAMWRALRFLCSLGNSPRAAVKRFVNMRDDDIAALEVALALSGGKG